MSSILGNLGLGGKSKAKAKAKTIKRAEEPRIRIEASKTKKVKKSMTKKISKVKKFKSTSKKNKQSVKKESVRRIAKNQGKRIITPKRRKPRKPRTPNVPDWSYAAVYRTNVCGTTKRRREGINLQELFDSQDAPLRRSKTMQRTIEEAEKYLRNKYDDANSMAQE